MSVFASLRCASRARVAPSFARRAALVQKPAFQRAAFSSSASKLAGDVDAHDPHHEESFEEFTARYAARGLFLSRILGMGWRMMGGSPMARGRDGGS